MSHTTTRQTELKDLPTLKKAIARIPGASYMGIGTGRTYSGTTKRGHQVQLPGWNYPVTIDTVTGEAVYDNYGGHWGSEEQLDKLNQGYAVEAARTQAEAENCACEEIKLDDGSIKLIIPLGGGYETTEGSGEGGSGYAV